MSMPGWRRRSWSMALWPPLAAYLPKVWSMHSYTINDNQQFQQHQNARHQHLVLTWGLWLLLDFVSWLVDHCPALLSPLIYDHVKGHIMILVIMWATPRTSQYLTPCRSPKMLAAHRGSRVIAWVSLALILWNWLSERFLYVSDHPLFMEFMN